MMAMVVQQNQLSNNAIAQCKKYKEKDLINMHLNKNRKSNLASFNVK